MNKKILSLLISFAMVVSFSFITGVKAAGYEENAFTDGKCINTDAWKELAMTGYTLNTTNGVYQLSGEKYSEANATTNHIFYVTSSDGKLVGAFVPNYNALKADSAIQTELFNKGIVTTQNCNGTYVMVKTVVGNPPTEDSVVAGIETDADTDEDGDDTPASNEEQTTDSENDPNEQGVDKTVEKLESPNTASPMAITAIVISVILVGVAVYSYLLKTKPELFKKNK